MTNDFDFLEGSWLVHNRTLVASGGDDWKEFDHTATNVRLFDGAANVDWNDFTSLGTHGLSLRLYDPAAQVWRIYWASSRDGILGPHVEGAFVDGVLHAYGDDTLDGRPIRVLYHWSQTDTESPRWEQAYSTDGGQTWEVNWVMSYTRQSSPPDQLSAEQGHPPAVDDRLTPHRVPAAGQPVHGRPVLAILEQHGFPAHLATLGVTDHHGDRVHP